MSATPIPDYFTLFGLAPRFGLDEAELARAYRRVQSQVHPDRFASAAASDRRVAMQWATLANEAFQTLRAPLGRAAYLCRQHGMEVDGEGGAPMPAAFLHRQMAWREALEEAVARRDAAALAALGAELDAERAALVGRLEGWIDEAGDFTAAADGVRRLMFIDKLGAAISAAAETCDARAANPEP